MVVVGGKNEISLRNIDEGKLIRFDDYLDVEEGRRRLGFCFENRGIGGFC